MLTFGRCRRRVLFEATVGFDGFLEQRGPLRRGNFDIPRLLVSSLDDLPHNLAATVCWELG
ncbi:MAG TPA: hypothetical protein VJ826_02305 [Candidatus Polarisedimenticolaceae bacterium]|nr:hypothetical protein [Candidatus Polarisedimenticolaceae bacterium]